MHQLIDKKNKIVIYLVFLIILSTPSNKLPQTEKTYSATINKFVVTGLPINNNLQITEKLNELIFNNIFFLNKENISRIMSEYNLVERYSVKKIYPKQINIKIEPTQFIARIKGQDQFLIGSNGKLISKEHTDKQLPLFFGKFDSERFLEFKEIIKNSEFKFEYFKSIFFYSSNRWDVQTLDNILIKLPKEHMQEALRIAYKVINDGKFKNNTIIDLRISNYIITQK